MNDLIDTWHLSMNREVEKKNKTMTYRLIYTYMQYSLSEIV